MSLSFFAAPARGVRWAIIAAGLLAANCGLAGADLRLTVSHELPDFYSQTYGTTFKVENVGDEAATSVSFHIDAPPELALGSEGYSHYGLSEAIQYGSDPDGKIIDLLPAGTAAFYIYYYKPSPSGRFDVTASVDMAENDPTPEDNSVTVKLHPSAELTCTMVAQPNEIPLFGTTSIALTCTNTGNIAASDPELVLRLGQDQIMGRIPLEYVSGFSSKGTIFDGGMDISLRDFQLEPGETVTMTAVIKALWPGQRIVGLVRRDGQTHFDGLDNPTIPITVTGQLPNFDVAASMKLSPSVVQPGGLMVQQMTVTNLGPDDATSISLYTQIGDLTSPFGTIEGSANLYLDHIVDAGPWNISTQDHIFQAKLPFLAAGDSASVTLVMRVKEGISTNTLTHYCQVSSDWWYEGGVVPVWNGDIFNPPAANPLLANNAAQQTVAVNLTGAGDQSDLEITGSAPLEAPVGQAYSYTVRARNNGPHPTTSAFVSNVVSQNLTVVGVQADKGKASVAGRFVALEDVPLAVGESATLNVTVVPNQVGQESYAGSTASSAFDANLTNNFLDDLTVVTADGPVVYPDQPCVDMPDLVGKITKVTRKGKFKKKTGEWNYKVQAKVEVSNIGTGCAMDKSTVRLYLSTNPVLDAGDMLIGGKQIKKLCPPKNTKKAPKPKKVSIKAKLAPGVNPVGCYVIAVIDADGSIYECNEANNIALSLE